MLKNTLFLNSHFFQNGYLKKLILKYNAYYTFINCTNNIYHQKTMSKNKNTKKSSQQSNQQLDINTLDLNTATADDLIKIINEKDNFDEVFSKCDELFLGISNQMTELDEEMIGEVGLKHSLYFAIKIS